MFDPFYLLPLYKFIPGRYDFSSSSSGISSVACTFMSIVSFMPVSNSLPLLSQPCLPWLFFHKSLIFNMIKRLHFSRYGAVYEPVFFPFSDHLEFSIIFTHSILIIFQLHVQGNCLESQGNDETWHISGSSYLYWMCEYAFFSFNWFFFFTMEHGATHLIDWICCCKDLTKQ